MDLLHLLEPEKSVGTLWHRLIGGGASTPRFPNAAVRTEDISARLSIFFRGIGGDAGVEIKSAVPEVSHHRLNRLTRLGTRSERVARADSTVSRSAFPTPSISFRKENTTSNCITGLRHGRSLAATRRPLISLILFVAISPGSAMQIARPAGRLSFFRGSPSTTIACASPRWHSVPSLHCPSSRPKSSKGSRNALRDTGDIRSLSRTTADEEYGRAEVSAPRGYCPYLPVPVWGEIDAPRKSGPAENTHDEDPGAGKPPGGDGESRRAERRPSEQVRKGGLLVHRFDKILTWTEFMNLHREVEDDDEDGARKAADDHDVSPSVTCARGPQRV